MRPKREWQIPITPVDSPRDFDGHKAIVEKILAGMTDKERDIVANAAFTKVEISGKSIGDAFGQWNARERVVKLSTAIPKTELPFPVVLKPLFTNFEYVAAHEMHHPLFHHSGHASAYKNPLFAEARAKAVDRIMSDPVIAAKVREVTMGMQQFLESGMPDHFVNIDFGWKHIDPHNREQVGTMLGILLSDEFHHVFRYTASAASMRLKDTRYVEMLCNLRAMSWTFGEDKVREFAPELLDYAKNLTEKVGVDTDKPPPGAGVLERMLWEKRRRAVDDHTGQGDGMSMG